MMDRNDRIAFIAHSAEDPIRQDRLIRRSSCATPDSRIASPRGRASARRRNPPAILQSAARSPPATGSARPCPRARRGLPGSRQSTPDAGATLKINLTAIGFNWERLAKSTDAECAAVLECNAYGCGIDPVADALAKSGCQTFFVTNLAEARRVRTAAPDSIIYVLHGLHAGAPRGFAELNAQPVINSAIELAEWDAFITSNGWSGGCALNIRLGLSMTEAVQLSGRESFLNHGITLLMLASSERANDPQSERQICLFSELRRLYRGIPASLVGASAILCNRRSHFDLVRADWALFGINPIPGSANPMRPVVELRARIVHVRDMVPGQSFIDAEPKRRRLALVSIGHADGFPRSWLPNSKLYAIVGGYRLRSARLRGSCGR